MNAMEIAQAIRGQIRTTELWAIGAKNFCVIPAGKQVSGGLVFDASLYGRGRCRVAIGLNGKDLYDVLIMTGRGYTKILAEFKDVFCEDLESFVVGALENKFKTVEQKAFI